MQALIVAGVITSSQCRQYPPLSLRMLFRNFGYLRVSDHGKCCNRVHDHDCCLAIIPGIDHNITGEERTKIYLPTKSLIGQGWITGTENHIVRERLPYPAALVAIVFIRRLFIKTSPP